MVAHFPFWEHLLLFFACKESRTNPGSFNMVGVQHATVGAVAGADEPAPQNADPLRCLPLAQIHSMPVWQASVGRVEGELKRRTCSVLVALWLCLAHLAMPPTLPNGTSMAGGGAWRKRQHFQQRQQHCVSAQTTRDIPRWNERRGVGKVCYHVGGGAAGV